MHVLNKYIIMVVLLSFFTESRESLMTIIIYMCIWVQSSTLESTFLSLFFFSIPMSLLMDSLPLQTIVNTWQHFHLFFKACTSVRAKINLQH